MKLAALCCAVVILAMTLQQGLQTHQLGPWGLLLALRNPLVQSQRELRLCSTPCSRAPDPAAVVPERDSASQHYLMIPPLAQAGDHQRQPLYLIEWLEVPIGAPQRFQLLRMEEPQEGPPVMSDGRHWHRGRRKSRPDVLPA